MIRLEEVAARAGGGFRKAASVLAGASLAWERGVLAVVGTSADGTTALLEVLAGAVAPKRGRVVIGGRPDRARPRVVHVRAEPELPAGHAVEELVALSAALRGEPAKSAAIVLGGLDVAHLAKRTATSLARGEARAVQLALALAADADVLLVEEPFAGLEPPAAARLAAELRAVGPRACVIVTTASVREALELGDRVLLLVSGRVHEPAEAHLRHGEAGATLRVVLGEGHAAFVEALRGLPEIVVGEPIAYTDDAVAVHASGPDLVSVGEAVMRASAASGVSASVIATEVAPLHALRAATRAPSPGAA